MVGNATVNRYDIQAAPTSSTTKKCSQFLKPIFPGATGEQLNSRHHNEYASFKIGIFENNAKGLSDPSIWNEGIKIKPIAYEKKTGLQNKKIENSKFVFEKLILWAFKMK